MNCEEETFSLHVDSPCHSQMQSSSMLRWLRTPESGKIQIGNHPYHVAKKEQHHQLCTTTQKAREGRRETAATGRHSRPKRMTSMALHIAQVRCDGPRTIACLAVQAKGSGNQGGREWVGCNEDRRSGCSQGERHSPSLARQSRDWSEAALLCANCIAGCGGHCIEVWSAASEKSCQTHERRL
jgi:hypothetical protein